ncbi:T-complex protein 1 subunit eta [Blattella germanica]|nr:T-complex protein 1 subunit eta [Blattella germanica]
MQPQIILLKEGTENSQGKPQLISNINACQAVADAVRTTLGPRGMDKLIVDNHGKSTISNDGATIMKLLDIVHPAAKTLIEKKNTEEHRQLLEKCAATALSSKLVSQQKGFFSKIVVDAVLFLDDHLPLNMIGIKKVPGGALEDSLLVAGVAFKKTFSYAGFEMQPKKYDKPKIALLNIELELKAERDNAEVRVESIAEYQKIVDAEDMFCAGRVPEEDLKRTMKACGGSVMSTAHDLNDSVLGNCEYFEEKQIGGERYNIFTGCPNAKTCTIVLRGGAEQFMEETERSLHDAIMIVRRTIKNDAVVAGKEQLLIGAIAKALEVIPRQLCDNAGFDATNILNKLRQKHAQGQCWYGVDINKEDISDNFELCVWEPAVVKINALTAACEAASLVLSVDETIKNPKSGDGPQGPPMGRGMGRPM